MNSEVVLTLDEAVHEVLNQLTGLDLEYEPELDRYRSITRALNRALRANALEHEWSYYSDVLTLGRVRRHDTSLRLPGSVRPRIVDDDAVRLVDTQGRPLVWAYMLPRDAIHKYANRQGLWCVITNGRLMFSRPINSHEAGLLVQINVQREPVMFRLPVKDEDVPDDIREQAVDFDFPDAIVARAAYLYGQTDPMMQPRAQTLEASYKDLMYQLIERDTRHTDSSRLNEFILPVQSELRPEYLGHHLHPHAG